MNILVITPRFSSHQGGDGLYAFNLGKALSVKGLKVHVLTIVKNKFLYLLLNGIESENLDDCLYEKTFIGDIDQGVFEENFFSFSASSALQYALEKSTPDIIHIHGIHQYFTLSCLNRLKDAEIPTIFTVHDYKILCGNAGFFSDKRNDLCLRCLTGGIIAPILERCKAGSFVLSAGTSLQMGLWKVAHGLKSIDYFHCGSNFVYELLGLNNKTAGKRVELQMPFLRISEKLNNLSKKKPIIRIAYLGRMVAHKGPMLFAKSIEDINNVPIDIFGDGSLFQNVKAAVYKKSNVTLHGWQSQEYISQYFQVGTIVVLPYLAHETFCYAALEAMIQGCCVVAGRRGAIPELIQDQVNGILLDEITPSTIHFALNKLLNNPQKVYELGNNAKQVIFDLDSVDIHAEKMILVYDKMVEVAKKMQTNE